MENWLNGNSPELMSWCAARLLFHTFKSQATVPCVKRSWRRPQCISDKLLERPPRLRPKLEVAAVPAVINGARSVRPARSARVARFVTSHSRLRPFRNASNSTGDSSGNMVALRAGILVAFGLCALIVGSICSTSSGSGHRVSCKPCSAHKPFLMNAVYACDPLSMHVPQANCACIRRCAIAANACRCEAAD